MVTLLIFLFGSMIQLTEVPTVQAAAIKISSIAHSDVTQTGWIETWSKQGGTPNGYYVYINNKQVSNLITNTSYTVTGETPGTTYSVRIVANNNGFLVYSPVDSVTTLSTPPTLTPAADSFSTSGTVSLTYDDNSNWDSNITSLTIDGTTTVPGGAFGEGGGSIYIGGSSFNGAGTHTVVIHATGYADATVTVNLVVPSTDAKLSGLNLNQGTLSPTFTSGTTSYTASVGNSVTSLTLTPTTDQGNAMVTVNGSPVSSGSASSSIPLNVGRNTISVIVTAQDGTTTETYTLDVTRAPNSPTGLSVGDVTSTGGLVSWSSVTGATGYDVYENGSEIANNVTDTNYHVTGLSSGTSYTVTVASVLNGVESAKSQPITVTTVTNPLTISVSPTVISTSGSVYVSGNAAGNAQVTLSSNDGGSWSGNGSSTSSTVYSVYANSQGAYNISWTAPTTPGVFTLSATSDGTTVDQAVAVTPLTNPVSTTPVTASSTANTIKNFSGLANPDSQTSNVQIDIPQGAFGTDTSVFVTSTSNTSKITPNGMKVVADVGVNFSGTPTQPLTVTIQNPKIEPGDVVYKILSNGTYQQIPSSNATVTSGQAVISFENDPTFVVTKPIGIVAGPVPPFINTVFFTENPKVGTPYHGQVSVVSGMQPYTWSITNGSLPKGLTLNNQGEISGIPTGLGGQYTFTVQVMDANHLTATRQLSLSVDGPSSYPTISMPNINATTVGTPYSQTLSATGGSAPYAWSVTQGTLPTGFTLNSQTGTLTGTPMTGGQTAVTVKVTDAYGNTATQTLTLDALKADQRAIVWNGKVQNVPAIVGNDGGTQTTYMPIWYVMQWLNSMGIQSTWNGHTWQMTSSGAVDLSNVQAGSGSTSIYLNGMLVQDVDTSTAVDPSTGKATTYMPIYYVEQILKRFGFTSTWDGTTWTVTK